MPYKIPIHLTNDISRPANRRPEAPTLSTSTRQFVHLGNPPSHLEQKHPSPNSPFTSLKGRSSTRGVSSTTAPLAQALLSLPNSSPTTLPINSSRLQPFLDFSPYSLFRVGLVFNAEDWRFPWARSAHPRPSPASSYLHHHKDVRGTHCSEGRLQLTYSAQNSRPTHNRSPGRLTSTTPQLHTFPHDPRPVTRSQEPLLWTARLSSNPQQGLVDARTTAPDTCCHASDTLKGRPTHAVSVVDTLHSIAQVQSRKGKAIPRRQLSRRILLVNHG